MKSFRVILGIACWLLGGAGLFWLVQTRLLAESDSKSRLLGDLWEFATESPQTLVARSDRNLVIGVGDPIFLRDESSTYHQMGEIVATGPDNDSARRIVSTSQAVAALSGLKIPSNHHVVLHQYETPQSLDWVLRTMLPARKRQAIAREISTAVAQHQDVIIAELKPIVIRSLREAMLVVESDLIAAIKKRDDELARLAGRYQRTMVEERIVPLVRKEIWPIIRKHAEPTADEIGRGLWERVSVWRFAWRYLYDQSPLPERTKVQEEWERFVEQEALPEVEQHIDEIIEVIQKIVTETIRNKKVQLAIRESLTEILEDSAVQRLVWDTSREVFVENPRVHEVVGRNWRSPEAQRAFQLAGARLQPTVNRIGELLFGTRRGWNHSGVRSGAAKSRFTQRQTLVRRDRR